jgi:hypothetical protein
MMTSTADFLVGNYGGMRSLTPMTQAAREACEDGTIAVESWQMLGGSVMVDHRMADDLIQSLQEDGFVVAEE